MNERQVTVEAFFQRYRRDLGLKLIAGADGLKRIIREPTVNRPGLALAGFKRYFAPKRVQVIGNVETAYLRSLKPELRRIRVEEIFRHRIPCLALCRDLRPEKLFVQAAEANDVPLFTTSLITMKFISRATLALENLFAPTGQVHGCMVDVQGVGVIIQGESGIGKSEAVLGLLERGHSLVADDVVQLRVEEGNELFGNSKELGQNLMEVRGIGLIDVTAMFGVAAIRHDKRVDLVVNLKRWEEVDEVDRLGLEQKHISLLGIDVPFMEIPVRPGRDLGNLVEVAAFQTKLHLAGYNAAQEFSARLSRQMAKPN